MIKATNSRILFLFDLLAIYLSFLFVYIHYRGLTPIPFHASLLMGFVGLFWFLSALFLNNLRVGPQSSLVNTVRDVFVSYSVLTAAVIAVVGIFGDYRHNDRLILYPLLFSVIASATVRVTYILTIRHFVRNGYQQKSVLVIGSGRVAEEIIERIQSTPEIGYRLYGVLADECDESLPKGLYLGRLERFSELVRAQVADEVIIALPFKMEDTIVCMVDKCEHEGVRFRIAPDFHRLSKGKIGLDALGGVPLLSVRSDPLSLLRNRILKRAFDVLFSLLVLILSFPLLLILAVLIKVTSPGPVLFKQNRVGINNRQFNMHKFRSMRVQEATQSDTIWTTENDPRVTSVGRFMRKTNLDELPQFWNVLVGDMSVVGPRPEREHFVEQFADDIPNYKVRHLVKSGITGLAQVNGWRGDTSIAKRVECDIRYLEDWKFWLDVKIIWLTVFGKRSRQGAY
jgi:Undecaprenyl-phosphate glucose phosphotransferase